MSRQDRRSGTASRTVRMTSGDSSTFSTVTTAPRLHAALRPVSGMARGCTSIRRYARPHEPAGRYKICRSWRAGFLVGMGATTADTIFLAVSVAAHSAVVSIQGWVPFIALLGAGLMA